MKLSQIPDLNALFKGKISAFIDKKIIHKTKIAIACSGGIDSVVLTHVLHELGLKATILHCNFNLRGEESKFDQIFVEKLALAFDWKIRTKEFSKSDFENHKRDSIQMAARKLRYQWWDQLLRNGDYDWILTAHHGNDALETHLMYWIRRGAFNQFWGIQSQRGQYLRPLLLFSKNQIEKYALYHNLKYRLDSSNVKDDYLRNKIRHKVVPEMIHIGGDFLDNLQNHFRSIEETREALSFAINRIKTDFVVSYDSGILALDNAYYSEITWHKTFLGGLLYPLGFLPDQIDNILQLTSQKKSGSFPGPSHQAWLTQQKLWIIPNIDCQKEINNLRIDEQYLFNGFRISLHNEQDNSDTKAAWCSIEPNELKTLGIRLRQNGDSYKPDRLNGKKCLISDLFINHKIPKMWRDIWPIFISKNEIWWIPFIDQKTKNINISKNNIWIKCMLPAQIELY